MQVAPTVTVVRGSSEGCWRREEFASSAMLFGQHGREMASLIAGQHCDLNSPSPPRNSQLGIPRSSTFGGVSTCQRLCPASKCLANHWQGADGCTTASAQDRVLDIRHQGWCFTDATYAAGLVSPPQLLPSALGSWSACSGACGVSTVCEERACVRRGEECVCCWKV